MAYSKAELKSIGYKASPCFTPFWIAYQDFTIGSVKHILSTKVIKWTSVTTLYFIALYIFPNTHVAAAKSIIRYQQ
jgi:hypothetical protein